MLKFDQNSIQKRRWILDRFLDRFLMALGGDFGVILTSKIDQQSILKFDRFSHAFWEGFGAAFLNYHGINSVVSDKLGAPGGG